MDPLRSMQDPGAWQGILLALAVLLVLAVADHLAARRA